MPKLVDHEARRREIVAAYLTAVSRIGHRATTSRAVAEELGVAVSVLWHYFPSFDQVIERAAAEVGDRTLARIEASASGLRSLARIEAIMDELLPVSKQTRDEAAVVVGFWGLLARRSRLSSSAASRDAWSGLIEDALREALADGELRPDTPVQALVAVLRSITFGQQVEQVIVEETTPEQHRAVLRACLQPWLPEAGGHVAG